MIVSTERLILRAVKKTIFILTIFLFGACQDIANCDTNDEQSFMILEFLDKETEEPIKTGFTITATGSPYAFIPFRDDSSAVRLPLNPNEGSVTFYFDSLDTSIRYELEMSYGTQVSIFDEDCPPSITFMNLDTLRHTFSAVKIPGTITNRLIETNVQVFL